MSEGWSVSQKEAIRERFQKVLRKEIAQAAVADLDISQEVADDMAFDLVDATVMDAVMVELEAITKGEQ